MNLINIHFIEADQFPIIYNFLKKLFILSNLFHYIFKKLRIFVY